MTFILNKSFVFIDSVSFLNSSVEKKVTNLLGDDFKYSMNFFVVWSTDERRLALFPAGPLSDIINITNLRHVASRF